MFLPLLIAFYPDLLSISLGFSFFPFPSGELAEGKVFQFACVLKCSLVNIFTFLV